MLREWTECIWPYLNFLLPRCVLLLFVCPFACCCFESPFGVAGKSISWRGFLGCILSTGPARFGASCWESPGIPGHLERGGPDSAEPGPDSAEPNWGIWGGQIPVMRRVSEKLWTCKDCNETLRKYPTTSSWAKLLSCQKDSLPESHIWWVAARRPALNLISAFAQHGTETDLGEQKIEAHNAAIILISYLK